MTWSAAIPRWATERTRFLLISQSFSQDMIGGNFSTNREDPLARAQTLLLDVNITRYHPCITTQGTSGLSQSINHLWRYHLPHLITHPSEPIRNYPWNSTRSTTSSSTRLPTTPQRVNQLGLSTNYSQRVLLIKFTNIVIPNHTRFLLLKFTKHLIRMTTQRKILSQPVTIFYPSTNYTPTPNN